VLGLTSRGVGHQPLSRLGSPLSRLAVPRFLAQVPPAIACISSRAAINCPPARRGQGGPSGARQRWAVLISLACRSQFAQRPSEHHSHRPVHEIILFVARKRPKRVRGDRRGSGYIRGDQVHRMTGGLTLSGEARRHADRRRGLSDSHPAWPGPYGEGVDPLPIQCLCERK
jgi:hypothetical protein